MSITYVNIGSSCEGYSPIPVPANIRDFYLSSSGALLNNSRSAGNYYRTTALNSQITVSASSYYFDAFSNVNFLTTTGDFNKRFLEPASGATRTTDYTSGDTTYEVATSTSWTSSAVDVTYNGVTYTRGTSITTALLDALLIKNVQVINNFNTFTFAAPVDVTTGAAGSKLYYLRKIGNQGATYSGSGPPGSIIYARWNGTTLNETDVGDPGTNVSMVTGAATQSQHQFQVRILGTTTRTVTLCDSSSSSPAAVTGLNLVYDSVNSTFYVRSASATYLLDSSTPQDDTYPVNNTLIKYVPTTGQYLMWNGTFNISSTLFTVADYWGSGLTSAQLGARTIFKWYDITPFVNNTALGVSPTTVDLYIWGFEDAGQMRYLYYNGTSLAFTAGQSSSTDPRTILPANEGWAIRYDSGDTSFTGGNGQIVYVRSGTIISVMDFNGSLATSISGSAVVPTAAQDVFRCVRCSSISGSNNLCSA